MNKTLLALALLSFSTLAGCAASTDSEDAAPAVADGQEEELKSADCPRSVEVLLLKPSVASDASLKTSWARDLDYETDPNAAAAEQMTQLASHVAKARAQTAVKLRGTIGRACAYATVDAQSGQPNGYRIWFAKSYYGRNAQLQLRIERDLGTPDDALFFKAPMSSLTPTSVSVAPGKTATVYAQHHSEGYHGEPDGTNAWLGNAKVTVTLAP